jgi:hypothetical protein
MRQRTLAGTGGIAFGALTLAATLLARAPGGNYSASYVAGYLAPGHRAAAIASLLLALLGVGARLLAAGRRAEPLAAPRPATP